jgi:hypothetical protein
MTSSISVQQPVQSDYQWRVHPNVYETTNSTETVSHDFRFAESAEDLFPVDDCSYCYENGTHVGFASRLRVNPEEGTISCYEFGGRLGSVVATDTSSNAVIYETVYEPDGSLKNVYEMHSFEPIHGTLGSVIKQIPIFEPRHLSMLPAELVSRVTRGLPVELWNQETRRELRDAILEYRSQMTISSVYERFDDPRWEDFDSRLKLLATSVYPEGPVNGYLNTVRNFALIKKQAKSIMLCGAVIAVLPSILRKIAITSVDAIDAIYPQKSESEILDASLETLSNNDKLKRIRIYDSKLRELTGCSEFEIFPEHFARLFNVLYGRFLNGQYINDTHDKGRLVTEIVPETEIADKIKSRIVLDESAQTSWNLHSEDPQELVKNTYTEVLSYLSLRSPIVSFLLSSLNKLNLVNDKVPRSGNFSQIFSNAISCKKTPGDIDLNMADFSVARVPIHELLHALQAVLDGEDLCTDDQINKLFSEVGFDTVLDLMTLSAEYRYIVTKDYFDSKIANFDKPQTPRVGSLVEFDSWFIMGTHLSDIEMHIDEFLLSHESDLPSNFRMDSSIDSKVTAILWLQKNGYVHKEDRILSIDDILKDIDAHFFHSSMSPFDVVQNPWGYIKDRYTRGISDGRVVGVLEKLAQKIIPGLEPALKSVSEIEQNQDWYRRDIIQTSAEQNIVASKLSEMLLISGVDSQGMYCDFDENQRLYLQFTDEKEVRFYSKAFNDSDIQFDMPVESISEIKDPVEYRIFDNFLVIKVGNTVLNPVPLLYSENGVPNFRISYFSTASNQLAGYSHGDSMFIVSMESLPGFTSHSLVSSTSSGISSVNKPYRIYDDGGSSKFNLGDLNITLSTTDIANLMDLFNSLGTTADSSDGLVSFNIDLVGEKLSLSCVENGVKVKDYTILKLERA